LGWRSPDDAHARRRVALAAVGALAGEVADADVGIAGAARAEAREGDAGLGGPLTDDAVVDLGVELVEDVAGLLESRR
jgi:hypothetical protein